MSAAADPTRASTPQPTRSGRLLSLVGALIDYARELLTSLRQHGPAGLAALSASGFYTADVAQVLVRVTRGLLRAEALQARLTLRARHLDAPRRPKPAAALHHAASVKAPRARTPDADPISLPTPGEIAAEVRRQPIGAVIVNICCDLGILPCHPLWRTLRLAIMDHGGSYVRLLLHVVRRPGIEVGLAIIAAAGTGPPPRPA